MVLGLVNDSMATVQQINDFAKENDVVPPRRVCLRGLVYDWKKKKAFRIWLRNPSHIFIRPNLVRLTGNFADGDSIWSIPLSGLPLRGREAMDEYAKRIRSTRKLWNALPSLTNKVLGCTCRTRNVCHGDILIRLWWDKFIEDNKEEILKITTTNQTEPERYIDIDEESFCWNEVPKHGLFSWADVVKERKLTDTMEKMTIHD